MLKAGRQLDALIAEKVFRLTIEWNHTFKEYPPAPITRDGCTNTPWRGIQMYSTDIGSAWQIVTALGEYSFTLIRQAGGFWTCYFVPHDAPDAQSREDADTAPLAICLAALKVVGFRTSPLGPAVEERSRSLLPGTGRLVNETSDRD